MISNMNKMILGATLAATMNVNAGIFADIKEYSDKSLKETKVFVSENKEAVLATFSAIAGGAAALTVDAAIVKSTIVSGYYVVTDGLFTVVIPFATSTAPVWVPVAGGLVAAGVAGGVVYCAYDNFVESEGENQGVCDDIDDKVSESWKVTSIWSKEAWESAKEWTNEYWSSTVEWYNKKIIGTGTLIK